MRTGRARDGGFLLPAVLLYLLALTSLVLAALTLARAEHGGSEWERSRLTPGEGAPELLVDLGGGYLLIAGPGAAAEGPRPHRVIHCDEAPPDSASVHQTSVVTRRGTTGNAWSEVPCPGVIRFVAHLGRH